MSSTADRANLARIRDNQRRSRARRKEYLQELEARLRQCEVQGIKAGVEIEQAAKKVLAVNQKLRTLLGRYGVGKDDVEAFSSSVPTPESNVVDRGEGRRSGSGAPRCSNAEQMLKQLLDKETRIPVGTWMQQSTALGDWSRDSSLTSTDTLPLEWEQTFGSYMAIAQQQYPTPNSSAGEASSICLDFQMQIHAASSTQDISASSNMPRQPLETVDIQNILILQRHIPASQSHPEAQSQQPVTQITAQLAKGSVIVADKLMPRLQTTQCIPTSTTNTSPAPSVLYRGPIETKKCIYAAEKISALTGRDLDDVLADLGCTLFPEAECEVDAEVVV